MKVVFIFLFLFITMNSLAIADLGYTDETLPKLVAPSNNGNGNGGNGSVVNNYYNITNISQYFNVTNITGVSGNGTTNYIARWITNETLGNSALFQNITGLYFSGISLKYGASLTTYGGSDEVKIYYDDADPRFIINSSVNSYFINNLLAPNICYANGTNCQATGGFTNGSNIWVNTIGVNTALNKAKVDINTSGFITGSGTIYDDYFGNVVGNGTTFTDLTPGTIILDVDSGIYSIILRIDSDTSMFTYPSISNEFESTWQYQVPNLYSEKANNVFYGESGGNPVLYHIYPNAALGDATMGFMGGIASSGGANMRMLSLIDRDQGSPYIYLENQDGSGNRIGANIIGLRTDGKAFMQTQYAFRFEGFGGGHGYVGVHGMYGSSSTSYPGQYDVGFVASAKNTFKLFNGTSESVLSDLILRNLNGSLINATNVTATLFVGNGTLLKGVCLTNGTACPTDTNPNGYVTSSVANTTYEREIVIIKSQNVDVAGANVTAWNNTNLNFNLATNTNYTLSCDILFTGAANTTGQAINLSTTATTNGVNIIYNTWSSGTARAPMSATTFGTGIIGTGSGGATVAINNLVADFSTTGTGSLNISVRSEVAGSLSTIKKGSLCQLYDVSNNY